MIDPANIPPNLKRAMERAPAMRSPLPGKPSTTPALPPALFGFAIVIHGQIRGGKNNMGVTRTGRHFPKPEWAKWRDAAVADVRQQLPARWKPINTPSNVRLDYVAGDKRRRDFPAICDAAWHVLEKAGVVTDDTLLWPSESRRSYDKYSPRLTITLI